MRSWFRHILREKEPNLLVMNYAYWDGLINHQKKIADIKIIDTYDIISLQEQMRKAIFRFLNPDSIIDINSVDYALIEEDFFIKEKFKTDSREFKIYDQYNHTIAISKKEVRLIKDNTYKTKVSLVNMTNKPYYLDNDYIGYAIYPTGPNPFNIQGYIYFVKKVLPRVLKEVPSFKLQVTGYIGSKVYITPSDGVIFSGFVPDLRTIYASSRFLVNPILGGTGQQVKIIEAMAHGIPAIVLREIAEVSPIQHNVNGFIANDSEEFAYYVIKLWKDVKLCRRLGNSARETISQNYSRKNLVESLSPIVILN